MKTNCPRIATGLWLMTYACLLLPAAALPELQAPQFWITPARGLGLEKGVCRRDPSDVIRVGSTYFVWYTKVRKTDGVFRYPSGYSGTVWYATSEDGHAWAEQGQAIGTGGKGEFDENGVFTPGILVARGKYYLFYTAVPVPMSDDTPTAIGIAVAASPHGPWQKFSGNPVLRKTNNTALFDSFRVDDACLLIRDGRYWLYYKGRQAGHTPSQTKWGVAIAENPTGPYVRYKGNPVVGSGHEVLAWPHRKGVAALVGPTGPEKNTIQYAPDGIHFRVISHFTNPPHAPGGYRLDAFTDSGFGRGMPWGISMVGGPDPYLVRFESDFVVNSSAHFPNSKIPGMSRRSVRGGEHYSWVAPLQAGDEIGYPPNSFVARIIAR
jgi:predicted GH43/DUF377 family glycosyl hydrolase